MSEITVTLGGTSLSSCNFVMQSFTRPSGLLRSPGIILPGQPGFANAIATPWDRNSFEMSLVGKVNSGGATQTLRSLVMGSNAWRALIFSTLSPSFWYVKGAGVDEQHDKLHPVHPYLTLRFLVSPPYLLGSQVTDTTSPVNNAGDVPCPAVFTITASGNFTLTVGDIVTYWTGGAGTVVINSETGAVTLGGTSSPQYMSGGFPWLMPGDNTVTLSAGTFSAAFYPRYA